VDRLHYSLTEYGDPVQVSLGNSDLEELRTEVSRWQKILGLRRPPISIAPVGEHTYQLRAEGAAGVISVGVTTIDICPKFLGKSVAQWKQILWNVLAVIGEVPRQISTLSAEEAKSGMLDQLGWMFIRSLESGRQEGLPRGYTESSESLPTLRGRLDVSKLRETLTRPNRLPCIYEEYTFDVPMNRLLFWACRTLADRVNSPVLACLLLAESYSFTGVSAVPPSLSEVDRIQLPLLFEALKPAFDASKLLLRGRSIAPGAGPFDAPSFLWNSAVVYERFVGVILKRVAHQRSWQVASGIANLALPCGTQRPLRSDPDFRMLSGKTVKIVLDAKYKGRDQDDDHPAISDVYQVLAAGRLYRCDFVSLVYPTLRPRTPLCWKVREDQMPTNLSITFVNLSHMAVIGGERQCAQELGRQLNAVMTPRAKQA